MEPVRVSVGGRHVGRDVPAQVQTVQRPPEGYVVEPEEPALLGEQLPVRGFQPRVADHHWEIGETPRDRFGPQQ